MSSAYLIASKCCLIRKSVRTNVVDAVSKACFDMQPTNPHVDITPSGHYEVWIRTVDLVRLKDDIAQNRSPLINATHKASLPKLYEARAACLYKPYGKCIGMMTPERFHLLRDRFQKNGLHRDMSSPVHCLASEIAGLLQDHQARLKTPKAIQLTQNPTPVSYPNTSVQHYNSVPWSQKKKWRLLWFLILGTPHIGANVTVTLSLVPLKQCICHRVYRFLNLPRSV